MGDRPVYTKFLFSDTNNIGPNIGDWLNSLHVNRPLLCRATFFQNRFPSQNIKIDLRLVEANKLAWISCDPRATWTCARPSGGWWAAPLARTASRTGDRRDAGPPSTPEITRQSPSKSAIYSGQEDISVECQQPACRQFSLHTEEVWTCLGIGESLYNEVQGEQVWTCLQNMGSYSGERGGRCLWTDRHNDRQQTLPTTLLAGITKSDVINFVQSSKRQTFLGNLCCNYNPGLSVCRYQSVPSKPPSPLAQW